ncbi:gliding motility-associated C-terminal domain-containing protein [Pedobacter sp. UBA4863]|uniref:T9SS type B sorting domain-containing protein n=1 Tax=Pedobacter sp. UBA4863 TaxID=1947060 RepID=UPI0025FC1636|nr:gliding motility-associated C-terminal domain-containing protein [Pedobacter sp. UBA4863]
MKKYLVIIVCHLFFLPLFIKAQVSSTILSWNAAAATPGTQNATVNNVNLQTAVLSRGPSLIYSNSSTNSYIAAFPIGQDKAAAKNTGSYYQMTVQAKPGYYVSLGAIASTLRRSSPTSPDSYRWTYSLDGTTFKEVGQNDVVVSRTAVDNNNGEVQAPIDLSMVMELKYVPSTTTITFRMYAWGATSDNTSSANFGFGKFSATVPSIIFSGFVTDAVPAIHTITFDSKGGTSVSSTIQYHNSKIMAPTEPTRVDYGFGGWYKDEDYTSKWDFNTDIVQDNITLYAKWNDPRQTITFPPIGDKAFGITPFELNATSNSGLPITYEALTNNISINGATLTITGVGLATVKAIQPGDGNYNPATPVEVSFNINKGLQILTLDQSGPFSRYAAPISLTATSSANLPVTFSANEPTVAVLTADNKLIIKGLGTIKIVLSQAGNEFYMPAEVSKEVLIHTAGSSQLLVVQALSPNDDGINDVFIIEGIKAYPENQVKIMNRGGNLVYEKKGYDNDSVVFAGKSNGGDKLPDGTYYYSVEYKQNGQWQQKKGYLFIKK